MRRVDSFTSASSVVVVSVLATHSSPGSRASVPDGVGEPARTTPTSTPAAASAGAITQSRSTPRCVEPVEQRVLAVGERERVATGAATGCDLLAQRVERGELVGGDLRPRRACRSDDEQALACDSSSASTDARSPPRPGC